MNKKLVSLLSVMSVLFAGAAMAATVDGGPTDVNDANYSGYYQNDTEYTGAATQSNLGARYATDNSEYDLETEWTADSYTVNPGYYLPAGGTTPVSCPAGSFCVGSTGDEFAFSATQSQGIESCPADYADSDPGTTGGAGATGIGDCYRACVVADIEHSTSVTGNVYQNGKTTCDPVCAGGWHKEAGFDLMVEFTAKATNPNSISVNTSGYRNNSNAYYDRYGEKGQSYYGLTDPNTWAVDYAGFGMVRGNAMCSTQPGDDNNLTYTNPTIKETLVDEFGTGKYCYCNITSYKDAEGAEMSLLSPWVFNRDLGNASHCAVNCAYYCAGYAVSNSGFRSALFGSVPAGAASCSANRYKLKWQDAAGNVTETTNTVHGGSIVAPSTAPTKTGHTFRGWKLKKTGEEPR